MRPTSEPLFRSARQAGRFGSINGHRITQRHTGDAGDCITFADVSNARAISFSQQAGVESAALLGSSRSQCSTAQAGYMTRLVVRERCCLQYGSDSSGKTPSVPRCSLYSCTKAVAGSIGWRGKESSISEQVEIQCTPSSSLASLRTP